MAEHNLILEFYKPTYNLDIDYNGDGGLDLHFTSIKGEFFMTMKNSYDGIYFDDVDCTFFKGEMFGSVDLGDLVERIVQGEFRQTDGKAISDWGKRFLGDGEEQIEFNGKNYADGSLFWDDFFKEMPKDEIKDFLRFCEDYLYLPNIEVDTVSNKWDFENGKVELKSNDKWGIGISDDYNIISVDEFTCDSKDAYVSYFVASSESDNYYESKKSVRKNLKEEAMTWKLFRFIQDLYDVHYITEEQLNKFQKHDFSKKEIKVLEQNYEIYKTSNEFDEINNAIKSTVNMINSFKESIKEGISAFNKAIAKKYNGTESNGVGQYYLDWRFDLHDEKDNIEAIADRCGVTVEFQSDEGYFEVFEESKKCVKKSLKEKLNDNGDVKFNDVYSCDLVNVLTVKVYDKELYEKLREEDLVLYKEGVYEQIDWKSFQDEISYLRDDIYASEDFNIIFTLYKGALLVYVRDNTDDDTIMIYKLESKFVN